MMTSSIASLKVCQYSFTFLFAAELHFRIMAFGKDFFCNEDWNWALLDVAWPELGPFVVPERTSLKRVWAPVAVQIRAESTQPWIENIKASPVLLISVDSAFLLLFDLSCGSTHGSVNTVRVGLVFGLV